MQGGRWPGRTWDKEDDPFMRGCPEMRRVPQTKKPEKRETGGDAMKKYVCDICGYVYDPAVGDPDSGIGPDTPFENLPDDWACPVCGAGKDDFSPET